MSQKRPLHPTPYQITSAPEDLSSASSTTRQSCRVVLGAGLTSEVFFAAGWVNYLLQEDKLDVIDSWAGTGFGSYLLVLLANSQSSNWIEFQMAKFSGLGKVLSEKDNWFFKSKIRSYVSKHFSSVEKAMHGGAFVKRTLGSEEGKSIHIIIPIMKTSEGEIIEVSADTVPVGTLGAWIFHPQMNVFDPGPISLNEGTQELRPIASDAVWSSVFPDASGQEIFYFPSWGESRGKKHAIYSEDVLKILKEGQKTFRNTYEKTNVIELSRDPIENGFLKHRKLFLEGYNEAKRTDFSRCGYDDEKKSMGLSPGGF